MLWQVLTTVPLFGRVWLPPFFFSNQIDVFSQIVKWFSTGVIGSTDDHAVGIDLAFVIGSGAGILVASGSPASRASPRCSIPT